MSTSIKNIAIIGAGPASMIFAMKYKALNPNTNIDIYEKENFPRHRIGESLLSGILNPIKDLNLKDLIDSQNYLIKKGAAYKWGLTKDWWDVKFARDSEQEEEVYSWHVRRSDFDNVLYKEAKNRGVNFYMNSNARVEMLNKNEVSNISIGNEKKEYDYYVDASGLSKAILKKVGNPKLIQEDKRIALYGYIKDLKPINNTISRNGISIISFDKGWLWHIPVSEDITSVGIVTTTSNAENFNTIEKFTKQIKKIPEIKEILTNEKIYDEYAEEELTKLYSVKNWSYTNGKTFGTNWISIGDAAYFHDPILSQGVTLAVWSGFEAAIYLSNDDIVGFYSIYKDIYENLKKMTDYWYANNNVDGWYKTSQDILGEINTDNNIFEKEAFKYITFGEVMNNFFKTEDHAGGYDNEQRKKIYQNLSKVKK